MKCYPKWFKQWEGIVAIIDCFKVPTEKPSHVEANSQIFSTYKNKPTTRFLLACTPGGSISFISPPTGGNTSDNELVCLSGLTGKFKPGDACMADKGFRIEAEPLEGVRSITPPFVKKGKQFSEKNNTLNKDVTRKDPC